MMLKIHLVTRTITQSNKAHLFSPLYHSNVGEGTAAASHLSRAVRPRPTPWLFISWIDGATGENTDIRTLSETTWQPSKKYVPSSHIISKGIMVRKMVQCNLDRDHWWSALDNLRHSSQCTRYIV